eukprot:582384-Hanusia_phi.AAC.6
MGKSHFVDISAISGVQGASIVNKKQIHLLIDLVGYTGGGERANEVFASKVNLFPRTDLSYMSCLACVSYRMLSYTLFSSFFNPAQRIADFLHGYDQILHSLIPTSFPSHLLLFLLFSSFPRTSSSIPPLRLFPHPSSGFCASTGAPYMQHMIVDRVVAPPEFQSHFSEKLLVLPYSYFCNDHRQQPSWANIPSSKVSRNQFAELPSRGILLACFNQLYKVKRRRGRGRGEQIARESAREG